MNPTVKSQSYHRNGVGGAGFVVSLVDWPESGAKGDFVAISLLGTSRGGESTRGEFVEQTFVLNVPMLAAGNIAFAEGNSWRGSDALGPAVADFYHDTHVNDARPGFAWDPFGCGHVPEEAYDAGSDVDGLETHPGINDSVETTFDRWTQAGIDDKDIDETPTQCAGLSGECPNLPLANGYCEVHQDAG